MLPGPPAASPVRDGYNTRMEAEETSVAEQKYPATVAAINALLPQTQCGRCGYPGCRPYAEAVATGMADVARCAPGGWATAWALARLLGHEPPVSLPPDEPASTAVIRESACIGCVRCISACPVDAIIGAPGWLHTVITEDCTGCGLCVPACPVDCIDVLPNEPAA